MHPFAHSLQDLDIDSCSTAIVSVIFVFFIAHDAVGTFERRKGQRGSLRNTRDDGSDVKGEDGFVGVDGVGVQDLWEVQTRDDGFRKIRCERILVGASSSDLLIKP